MPFGVHSAIDIDLQVPAIAGLWSLILGLAFASGGASEVEATLKAGSYTYYCSVPGHEAAGMKGTLTVK